MKNSCPIIIFEGHDRSAKTTISEIVAKMLGTSVFISNSGAAFNENGKSKNATLFDYYLANYISELIKNGHKKPIILYRTFLSELVYSKLFNRETDKSLLYLIDDIYSKLNATIVLCEQPLRESFEDKYISDRDIIRSRYLFKEFSKTLKTDIFYLDTTEYQPIEHAKKVINYIKTKR